jgi:hypothetical protein
LAFNWLIVLTVLLSRPQTYTSIDTGCRFSSGIQGQGYRVFTLKLTDLRKVGGGRTAPGFLLYYHNNRQTKVIAKY